MDKKTRYYKLKAAGLCVECGKLPAAENSVHCEKSREMHRAKNNLYRARYYYERVESHKCVDCGAKLPPEYFYVRCSKCHEKNKKKQKEYYARRKHEQRKQAHNN